jgi:hypothetical protein
MALVSLLPEPGRSVSSILNCSQCLGQRRAARPSLGRRGEPAQTELRLGVSVLSCGWLWVVIEGVEYWVIAVGSSG